MKIIALILLIFCIPILSLISFILFIESGDGVIFKQVRIGEGKKEFTIFKLRTMLNNKATRVGRVIRKTGLDEIPQLYNIVKGEMSFVGPRPLTKFDIERLGWNTSKQIKRWSVKPGITGIAQLSSTCNADLSLRDDFYYVDNKSFILDCKLFVKSLIIPFFGKTKKK